MNTKSVKKTKLWIILISLFVVIEVLLIGATLAWFTDQKSSSATLKFGTIELDKAEGATGLAVSVNSTTLGTDSYVMPGDKVDININVKLKNSSQPAYYLVYLDHDGLFGDKEFFFKSGETVYATDRAKIYPVTSTGTIGEGTASKNVAGTISGGETQTLAFPLTIDEAEKDLTGEIEISCTVYAIQQANLTAEEAYDEIHEKEYATATFGTGMNISYDESGEAQGFDWPSWKQAITEFYKYETISFYRTGRQTFSEDLKLNQTLTDSFDATQPESEKGKIKVYTNGTSELAFVSDARIMAPDNCSDLFGLIEVIWGVIDVGDWVPTSANYKINFDNFYTDNVEKTYLEGVEGGELFGMFSMHSYLSGLDLRGWNLSNVKDLSYMFYGCSSLTSLNLSRWNTSNATSLSYMFGDCSSLTSLNLSSFDTNNVTDMESMFDGCEALTSITFGANFNTNKITDMSGLFEDLSNLSIINFGSAFDTSNVTNMRNMFKGCSSLTSLNLSNFNTSNVVNMSDMFSHCNSLTALNLSSFNTSNVTNMNTMFLSCTSLVNLNLSSFDTSNVTSMGSMFSNCSKLTSLNLSNFNTSKLTYMNSMFASCSSLNELDVSGINTSQVTAMGSWSDVKNGVFYRCSSLRTLNLSGWDTSKVEDMSGIFAFCSSLTSITFGDSFNTSNVKYMIGMFASCSSLNELDLSSFNTSNVTSMGGYTNLNNDTASMGMFQNCSSLTKIIFGERFNTSKVSYMKYMFAGCLSLKNLDLSNFDTSNVVSMSDMLYKTFGNDYSSSELIIGETFTYDDNGTQTPITKSKLRSLTGLNSDVVVKRGSETLG